MDILKEKIRHVPDFPKAGILFYDITTLLRDPAGFRAVVDSLALPFTSAGIDLVVGIESRGFILGGAVADRIGAGFSPVRKPGKLPSTTVSESYALEYGTDSLEIHDDAVAPGQRVLIVDDVIATGGHRAGHGRARAAPGRHGARSRLPDRARRAERAQPVGRRERVLGAEVLTSGPAARSATVLHVRSRPEHQRTPGLPTGERSGSLDPRDVPASERRSPSATKARSRTERGARRGANGSFGCGPPGSVTMLLPFLASRSPA